MSLEEFQKTLGSSEPKVEVALPTAPRAYDFPYRNAFTLVEIVTKENVKRKIDQEALEVRK